MTAIITNPTNATGAIAALERARTALMEAKSVKEVKGVRDMAETAKQLCKKARLGLEIQNEAALVALEAEHAAGVMLADIDGLHRGGDKKSNLIVRLGDIGIDRNQSHRWQRIATLPIETIRNLAADATASHKELTTASALRLAKKSDAKPKPSQPPLSKLIEKVLEYIESAARTIPPGEEQRLSNALRVMADRVESREFTDDL